MRGINIIIFRDIKNLVRAWKYQKIRKQIILKGLSNIVFNQSILEINLKCPFTFPRMWHLLLCSPYREIIFVQ
jgi:hypothetical protein